MSARRAPLVLVGFVATVALGPLSCALPGHVTVVPGRTVSEYVPLTADSSDARGPVRASVVAQARAASIDIFRDPGDDQPVLSLPNPTEDGAPRVFLAVARRADWLEVLLPVRPNDSVGWVRFADVVLKTDPYQVEVDLGAHRLTVTKGAHVIVDRPVGVGRAVTSTPKGFYYLTSLLQAPDPSGLYGPYAFGTSAFSDILTEFAGGNGVIGIHGTNDPTGIGHDVSHGCIRVDNDTITRLARLLPLGTPVYIQP
jgi:lipoprotein-anchoring transpeptidase ErfK/SrfK